VEERPERLEEHRVVKQIVHLGQWVCWFELAPPEAVTML
jgi:hypothetical protein